jgi:hypothetical protein
MKLFLLTQTQNNGYDTFDACVVAAKNADEASLVHPRNADLFWSPEQKFWALRQYPAEDSLDTSWADPAEVTVKYIGEASGALKAGVVLASFNAG